MKQYLAIDIGASSGRHILGQIENGKLVLKEIFRFDNKPIEKDGHLIWDTDRLFKSILDGIKKCKEIGAIPESIGIDTWGVDYALLDENDAPIMPIYSYRDNRTQEAMKKIHTIFSREELYAITGIQKQSFNTIYQLYSDKITGRLKNAKDFLLVPEFFAFLLTGKKVKDYTNASTTGLLNANTKTYSEEIIQKLGFDKEMFKPLSQPKTIIGELTKKVQNYVGFNTKVVCVATHDTASAVLAVPTNEPAVYISSGTWSLMGIESKIPYTDKESMLTNFTNEGSVNGKIRYLKNIMGLWMIQCVRHELDDKYSFSEFADMASKCEKYDWKLDVSSERYLAPKNMQQAIIDECKETNQKIPTSPGEMAYCIFNSLAYAYAKVIDDLENKTGFKADSINIVGGGCKNMLLNKLTAEKTGKKVIAGPSEATATGNLIIQLLVSNELKNLEQARDLVKTSLDITEVK